MVQRNFAVGDYLFGVRSNAPEVGDWLDVLSGYETDEEADPYYSIWFGEDEGSRRGFHIFYREAQLTLRTFDLAAIAEVFLSHLDALAGAHDDSAFHLRLGVIGRNDTTALIPHSVIPFLRDRGSQAERALDLPLTAYASVDLETAELLPPRRRLDVPPDTIGRLVALDPSGAGTRPGSEHRPLPDLTCGIHELAGDRIMPVSRAFLVYSLLGSQINLSRVGAAGIEALARLVGRTRRYGVRSDVAREMIPTLRDLLDDPPPVAEEAIAA